MLTRNQKRRINLVSQYCKGKEVLDLGCGKGKISGNLFNLGFNVEGIDSNKSFLREARQANKKIKYIFGDVENLKLTKKYDSIILYGILEYLRSNPTKILKKLAGNLNKDGIIIIGFPNTNSLRRRIKHLFGLDPVDGLIPKYQFSMERIKKVVNETREYTIMAFDSPKTGFIFGKEIYMPDFLAEDLVCIIKKI